jgi:CheY-like chemotaxis protein
LGARITVVDDDIENLRLMRFLLAAFGHTVLTASNGPEFLELVTGRAPDLALLDIQMPMMDGFETLLRARTIAGMDAVPMVAVTALAMIGDREAGIAAGFDGYITKPIQPERFAVEIDQFLPPELGSRLPSSRCSSRLQADHLTRSALLTTSR